MEKSYEFFYHVVCPPTPKILRCARDCRIKIVQYASTSNIGRTCRATQKYFEQVQNNLRRIYDMLFSGFFFFLSCTCRPVGLRRMWKKLYVTTCSKLNIAFHKWYRTCVEKKHTSWKYQIFWRVNPLFRFIRNFSVSKRLYYFVIEKQSTISIVTYTNLSVRDTCIQKL